MATVYQALEHWLTESFPFHTPYFSNIEIQVDAIIKTKDLEQKTNQPVFHAGAKLLEGFQSEVLKTIKRFIEEATAMQSYLSEKMQ